MRYSLDKITIRLLLLYFFVLYWIICFNTVLNNVFMILMLCLMVFSRLQRHGWKIKMAKKEGYFLAIFLVYMIVSIIRSGVTYRAMVNAFFIVCTLFCFFYLSDLYIEAPYKLHFLQTTRWLLFLNLYFWINAAIILLQSRIPGLLGAASYDDLTGFFGSGSTHNIIVYSVMMTCLNIKKLFERKYRIISIVYLASTIIMMFILAPINDNTAFFIFFPVGMALYICGRNRINVRTAFKLAIFFIIGIVCIWLFFSYNSSFNEFVNSRLGFKIQAYLRLSNNGMTSIGFGDERMRALEFAIKYGNGLFFGKGFNVDFADVSTLENYMVYAWRMGVNVGICDLSGITYYCGIWFWFFLCLCFTYMVNKMLFRNSEGNMFVIFGLVAIFTMYTTFTKSLTMVIVFFLVIASFENGWKRKEIYVFNSGNNVGNTYIQS